MVSGKAPSPPGAGRLRVIPITARPPRPAARGRHHGQPHRPLMIPDRSMHSGPATAHRAGDPRLRRHPSSPPRSPILLRPRYRPAVLFDVSALKDRATRPGRQPTTGSRSGLVGALTRPVVGAHGLRERRSPRDTAAPDFTKSVCELQSPHGRNLSLMLTLSSSRYQLNTRHTDTEDIWFAHDYVLFDRELHSRWT